MARMLSKVRVPQLCPFGCCRSHNKRPKKSNRQWEKQQWRKEL